MNTVGGSARLLLLAPPGAGKSTQGRLLGQAYGVPHISTGELMRDEMSAQSPVGRRVAGFVRRGELVPDDIVIDLVLRRLTEPVEIDGFVLDGFPRTLAQAEVAYAWAAEHGRTFAAVVHLGLPEAELARRAAERSATSGRPDDTAGVWRHRLDAYRAATEPLLGFYRARGILVDVDAIGTIEAVSARILDALAGAGLATPGRGP